jgi:DNA-binding response OmpR family regulator
MEDRILIVDDEEMICSVLSQRLTTEGYSCVTAHNGKEALNQFYKDRFFPYHFRHQNARNGRD